MSAEVGPESDGLDEAFMQASQKLQRGIRDPERQLRIGVHAVNSLSKNGRKAVSAVHGFSSSKGKTAVNPGLYIVEPRFRSETVMSVHSSAPVRDQAQKSRTGRGPVQKFDADTRITEIAKKLPPGVSAKAIQAKMLADISQARPATHATRTGAASGQERAAMAKSPLQLQRAQPSRTGSGQTRKLGR